MLGSELYIGNYPFWADNFRDASRSIIRPSFLLPWISARAGLPLNGFYGNAGYFLEDRKNYRRGTELFLFGYDWRCGIQVAAEELRNYINGVVRATHRGKIIFIAHSLGCIVVRWLLVKGLIDPSEVELVIAAAPPFLGSCSAFKSVVEMPDLHDLFDRTFHVAKRWLPNITERVEILLTRTLMAVPSLLELIPPRSIPFLSDGGPMLKSAFEWPGWPAELGELRNYVETVQNGLLTLNWPTSVRRTLIAGDGQPTEISYMYDPADPFKILYRMADNAGDGRVIIDSALAFGYDDLVLTKWRHDLIFDSPDTIQTLNNALP
jgi:hypothetical protein